MKRALVTFGVGDAFQAMLQIAWPTFQKFADAQGYEFIAADVDDTLGRPASWMKVPVLSIFLNHYDEVVWIDADAVIVDFSDDLDVPADYWQALVLHHTADGEVPSAGFWLLRKPMLPVLAEMWEMTQYLHHGWWEQRALADLLGYGGVPFQRQRDTELFDRTFILDNGWGVHVNDTTPFSKPRVFHASMYPDRIEAMREWVKQAPVGA